MDGNGNRLRLGLFGPNCSSGRTYAVLADRWEASWENNVRLAQMADEIGIECMVPIARWKGYGGASNPNGSSFESIAWAAGLLAATRRIDVFCTIHVPLHHPLVAAKQMATADHIGRGRLGVNIVCGWNDDEFQMFGVTKKQHDDRYAQGDEWWEIVKRIWRGEAPFDYDGTYYQLRGVQGAPRPYADRDPRMMNAGSSETGRRFAIRHSDMHFDALTGAPEASADRIAETKRLARERGREIQVWTPVGIVCRPIQKEADDYVRHVVEHADWGAIGYLAEMHAKEGRAGTDPQGLLHSGRTPSERRVLARGSYCVIGTPDAVAGEFSRLSAAGLDGLAVNFVDYLDELPYFAAEVLPRLERLGLRSTTLERSRVP